MFITKKHLPRRTFLRGIGATVALPLLDAMVPARTALAQTAAVPVQRIGFVFVPNGILMQQWTPESTGANFAFKPILAPLEPFRNHVAVVSNLARNIENGHTQSSASWLTCVKPKRTEGAEVRAGTTIDQELASRIGQTTPLPSLELATEDFATAAGACDGSYSCVYLNTLCWKSPTMPLPMEINPRIVFERLFGDGSTTAARARRLDDSRSLLDSVRESMSGLERQLGGRDRVRLNEYIENVREIERRIQRTSQQANLLPEVNAPVGVPASFDEHIRLMFELQALAFQVDLTRVATFMLARELSNQTYPQVDVPDPHHAVSHHGNNPENMMKDARVNAHHVGLFGSFVEKLRATPDGNGSLLDHSLLVYGAGISEGNNHTHDPLPIVLVGGAAGRVKGNRHVELPPKTPLANFWLTVADYHGVQLGTFGEDGTAPVSL